MLFMFELYNVVTIVRNMMKKCQVTFFVCVCECVFYSVLTLEPFN